MNKNSSHIPQNATVFLQYLQRKEAQNSRACDVKKRAYQAITLVWVKSHIMGFFSIMNMNWNQDSTVKNTSQGHRHYVLNRSYMDSTDCT